MANSEQEINPANHGWMEEREVNICYFSPNDLESDYDFPSLVPSTWITQFPFVDPNQIVLIDNDYFISLNDTDENYIYNVGGEPYIKIDYYAYPIIMLDKNGLILELSSFSTVKELTEAVNTIIILMTESQGYLNYSGQLIKEKK